ncbi:MAG TPA: 3-carboxy-cis,cis-muconate cycloisomerase [Candidatus Solibacter sp.]
MFTRLVESLAATEKVSEVFSDASVLQAMLDFEAALARAEAHCGMIPASAAASIADSARAEGFDFAGLARLSLRAGTPAIPLVKMLTARVHAIDPEAAGFVHWGATSQDMADTALVLLLRRVRRILQGDHERLLASLRYLSDQHAATVMLGRTLLQPASPVTFGLKAAGWFAALRRGWDRVSSRFDEALYLQFGGASGTLAALEHRGLAVSEALASELDLELPDAPWHGHRDRLAALMAALSIYTASLGKIALDVALLMQFEIGEAAEPGGHGRGGSSSMPHKRNPTACMLALASAKRVPGLLADFVAGMVQEQERAVGGWQAEWPIIYGIAQSAGVALESMAEVAEGLTVDVARMRANIDSTHGAVFAERAVLMLARELGCEAARRKVEAAIQDTGMPPDLPGLRTPENYLGSAEEFRRRLLQGDK